MKYKISNKCFKNKPLKGTKEANLAYANITRYNHLVDTDISGLKYYIENGYAIIPCSRKKDDDCYGCLVFFDFDDCEYSAFELLSKVKDVPTLYYPTFSDNGDFHRFRFVYCLSEEVSFENLAIVYNQLAEDNGFNSIKGFDRLALNQLYLGTNKRCYTTGELLDVDSYKSILSTETTTISNTTTEKSVKSINTPSIYNDYPFLDEFRTMTIQGFLDGCKELCTVYKNRTTLNFEYGELYREFGDEVYYETPKKGKYDREAEKYVFGRWNSGEGRNKKLFTTAILIHKFNEELPLEKQLYAYIMEVNKFFDLSDGKYGLRELIGIFERALNENEIKADGEKRKYQINKAEAKRRGISVKQANCKVLAKIRTDKKEERYALIDTFVDDDFLKLKCKEQLAILEENGIEISEKTFKTYKKDRGFTKNKKRIIQ